MRILYIWDADYPWDIRVEKICKSLIANGHEIHIAARNLKKLAENEVIDGLNIHRIRVYKNDKINYALSFPVFFSPVWRKLLDKVIKQHKIDLIIVRDLPMAVAGIFAAKRHNLPVVFDMAENYVAMLKNIWKYRKFEGLNLIVRNPYIAKYVEQYVLKRIDHILVVVDESKEALINKGIEAEKVSIIGNTPPLYKFNLDSTNNDEMLTEIKQKNSLIYVGGIQFGRGIHLVIQAVSKIIEKIPDFLFVVIGDGYAAAKLKELIKELHIENYIRWIGWVDHDQIYNYIASCKVGVIPHVVTDHTNSTIPNKLFDYMGFGLPVVASNAVPLRRILQEEKCGIVFNDRDANDLAEKAITIFNNLEKYSISGKNAVYKKYNWEIDSANLLRVISQFEISK